METRKTKIIRNKDKKIQPYRFYSQIFFSFISIWIGIDFYRFMQYLSTAGVHGSSYRPAGVEAYLPISSLMSVVYFFRTGNIHDVHPAGFFIFSGILLMSLFIGKSFCSWVCPVGFISELIGDFGSKLFKKKITLPRWIDYPLRSLKYLLLFFFFSTIITMSSAQLSLFLDGDYNIAAEIKMFEFFGQLTPFAIIVLSVLVLLSIPIKNFWCRFLCPYGALLGLTGFLSVLKLKRTASTCIDCDLCDKACPSAIKVSKSTYVLSDECTSCLQCVDVCPVHDTLGIKLIEKPKKMNTFIISGFALIIFLAFIFLGMITGNWQNKIPVSKYFNLYQSREQIEH